MNSVLEYAKLYASLGWKIFPVNKRKRPAVKWTTECTTDIKKIEDWYKKNPHLGVGIACGPSNLFVLDIDIKKDEGGNIKHNGFIELERLLDQHGSLPDTLISQTGGGGRHYFFRSSEGGAKDSAGKIAPAIDVRCNSGYVVAPPSLHETGKVDGVKAYPLKGYSSKYLRRHLGELALDLGKSETWVQQALGHAFDSQITKKYMGRVREDTMMDVFGVIGGNG